MSKTMKNRYMRPVTDIHEINIQSNLLLELSSNNTDKADNPSKILGTHQGVTEMGSGYGQKSPWE